MSFLTWLSEKLGGSIEPKEDQYEYIDEDDIYPSHQESVAEFMHACDQIGDKEVDPSNLTDQDISTSKLRLKLTIEEVAELFEAFVTKDVYDVLFEPLFGAINDEINTLLKEDISLNKVEIADAITDIDYVNTGIGVWLNLPLEDCFYEVHENNMTKVNPETGKVTKNESGKVLKPEGFQPVNLKNLLDVVSFR